MVGDIKRERVKALKKVIEVSNITSIKHNHFAFKDRTKTIESPPFIVKRAPDGSGYHFDKEDLERMSAYERVLAPHDDRDQMTRTEYIQSMKQEFFHQIRSGNMNEVLTKLYNLEEGSLELKWVGPIDPEF
ncbi:hypothetical protein BN1080_02778 [Planococcus massiliensis]|uniref:Uncharacterized protein n=1 Tax=Planococcus massiliensis TaxID=1499687 RepID=A0A098ENA2_9BACL|nr:hypothetical protein BN1080_02778 [Planococcus massiliensis]